MVCTFAGAHSIADSGRVSPHCLDGCRKSTQRLVRAFSGLELKLTLPLVQQVKEDTPLKVQGEDGELVEVPIKYESRNPNGFEVDNLYCKYIARFLESADSIQWT